MSVNSELELEIGNDFDNNMEKSENLDVPKTDVIKEIMSGSTRSGSSKKTSEKTEKAEKPERKVSVWKSRFLPEWLIVEIEVLISQQVNRKE